MAVETSTGALITLVDAPEHLGPGVIMRLTMRDPRDSRMAEVYLTPKEMAILAVELEGGG